MNIILLGKPGAGKGTQAKKISEYYQIPHISTGEMFRQAYKDKTQIGLVARDKYWGKGQLVPDDITIKLVEERLGKKDCKKGFILDGFPRTIAQAKALDKIVSIDTVIYLDAPEEMCIKRIVGRRNCPDCNRDYNIYFSLPQKENICDACHIPIVKRGDDTETVVKERLKVYAEQTRPLEMHYSKVLVRVVDDGKKSVENVFTEIIRKSRK